MKVKVTRPVVDALTFLLAGDEWHEGEGRERFEKICRRVDKAIAEGTCIPLFAQGTRYRKSFQVVLPSGKNATVFLGAVQPDRQNGGVRISLNPAKLKPGDIDFFHAVMKKLLGSLYLRQLETPVINRIDFAVDLIGAQLDKLLFAYTNAQKLTIFAKQLDTRSHIESIYFGSISSDYRAVVYDKKAEMLHQYISSLISQGLELENPQSNVIRKIEATKGQPESTRIEIRGQKLRKMTPSELCNMPNRFSRFKITDLSIEGAQLPELIEDSFLALCRQNGVKDAFEKFKTSRWSRKIHTYYRTRQASWWNPETMWTEACEVLKQSGIFPAEAFSVSDLREEDEFLI